jgi:hypothetical protein
MPSADLRARREAIVREHRQSENAQQLGLAHESTSLAGRVTTLVSHPFTVGRALARRASRSRPAPEGSAPVDQQEHAVGAERLG